MAKFLATRLKEVTRKLISPNQFAFLKGIMLVDGIVVVNEVIELDKKSKKLCLIFKVSFEKAFDSVSWEFLAYMLVRSGFNYKWRSWIRTCISIMLLVNIFPTQKIIIHIG